MSKSKIKHIIDVEYPYYDKWDKSRHHVIFKLANVHFSMANAIRRIMIADVPTVGFRCKPYAASQINIKINNTPHNNEELAHRISMIPIFVVHPEKFVVNNYMFILDVSNDSTNVKYITSNDFKVKHIPSGKFLDEADVKQLFPADAITNDYSVITILKSKNYVKIPNNPELSNLIPNTSEGEINRLYVEAKACICTSSGIIYDSTGTGELKIGSLVSADRSTQGRGQFSPVCVAAYFNTVDPKSAEEGFISYLESEKLKASVNKITPYTDDFLRKRFETNEQYNYYYKDDRGDPNLYTFRIETVGVIPPLIIFERAIEILKNKIMDFINNILAKKEDIIKIKPSAQLRGYDIHIINEDETLGYIIQNHLSRLYADYSLPPEKRLLSHIGFCKPYPLEKKIQLLVASPMFSNFDDIAVKIIKPGCIEIVELLNVLQKELYNISSFIEEKKSISNKI